MKDVLLQHINSVCEVRDMENALLTAGRIRRVLEDDGDTEESNLAIEIVSKDMEPLPKAPYDMPVKITLFGSDTTRTIGGHVYIANEVFWRINKIKSINDMERRNYFRVKVFATGKAYRQTDLTPEYEPEPATINIIDISLSGILFRTEAKFQVNDLLHIYDIKLSDDSPVFSMLCTVRRIEHLPKGGETLYGCSFENLSEKDEDILFSTIFKLHRLELQKRRKRL